MKSEKSSKDIAKVFRQLKQMSNHYNLAHTLVLVSMPILTIKYVIGTTLLLQIIRGKIHQKSLNL